MKSLDSRFHGNDGKAIYKQTLNRIEFILEGLTDGAKSIDDLVGREIDPMG